MNVIIEHRSLCSMFGEYLCEISTAAKWDFAPKIAYPQTFFIIIIIFELS